MDRITDRETNTLASRGLEEPFSSCAMLCQFLVLAGKRFWFVLLRVQYSCGVVVVFWLRWEIVFGVTDLFDVQYSCAVVSVFWL